MACFGRLAIFRRHPDEGRTYADHRNVIHQIKRHLTQRSSDAAVAETPGWMHNKNHDPSNQLGQLSKRSVTKQLINNHFTNANTYSQRKALMVFYAIFTLSQFHPFGPSIWPVTKSFYGNMIN